MISINQINQKEYIIPNDLNDRSSINSFLDFNKGKPTVVVQGLGFVGAVMSIVCANAINEEYAVIGVDLPTQNSYWRIKSINEGVFPVVSSDSKVEDYFKISRKKNNFLATYDVYAYSKADVIIVDVNLDVQKEKKINGELESFNVDLNAFKKAIYAISDNCKEDVLILIETTVPPGTTESVVKPIIDESFTKRGLSISKYKLGHSYERVMPGPNYIDSIQNFYRVYSGINDISAIEVESFLKTIISTKEYPLTKLGNTNATEMAKVLENSYRAMNIAFMVEWSRFAELADVNLFEVVSAIRMRPTHSNMMLPGIGVGGYCLTKDPLLASWAKQNLFNSEFPLKQSEKSVQINDQMPLFAFNYLKETFKGSLSSKKVLLLGVSYRSDISDTRYSPVEPFYDFLISEGATIYLHDPYVNLWEEKGIEVATDLDQLLKKDIDILVFCTNHSEYINNESLIQSISNKKNKNNFIFDTVGVLNKNEINILKESHTVKVVGRGDL